MSSNAWMQPALQISEAVLLPALEKSPPARERFGNRYLPMPSAQDTFIPAGSNWEKPEPFLPGVYTGSMAGRSVLRAAGIRTEPLTKARSRKNG